MNLLSELIEESRLLSVLYDNLPEEIRQSALYANTLSYLSDYAAFNKITAAEAVDMYISYIKAYNKHCKEFVRTGKYPLENNDTDFKVTREQYDVVLLLSVLFTEHRYRIMQAIQEYSLPADNALYIGLGTGLEIELTLSKYKHSEGYDLSVNDFLFQKFTNIQIKIELYTGQKQGYFDSIFLIELLEHLDDPMNLLQVCYSSLKPGGKIFLTTATNIPQFDHLYNFPQDHTGFENEVTQMGFKIIHKEEIPHHYLSIELMPCNHFYVVEKT